MIDCEEQCRRCFYCRAVLGRHEHDHFPIPGRHGGTQIVPCCDNCHTLKDRLPLDKWPTEAIVEIWREVEHAPPVVRLFVAKATALIMDANASHERR